MVTWVLLAGVGVTSAAPSDENPACNNPSQGFSKSTAASDGTSLEHAASGIINARTKIGCDRVLPG